MPTSCVTLRRTSCLAARSIRTSTITWLLGLMLSTTCLAAHARSCASTPGVEHFYATSWGIDERNTRFQPESDIDATNVASLEVHWIFGLDENEAPHSYPLVTEDSVFIGTTDGNLYALDKQSGCIRWVYTIDSLHQNRRRARPN